MSPVLFLALALALAIAAPAAAGEPIEEALTGLPVTGTAPIAFTAGVSLLTAESVARLKPLIAAAKNPSCYWIALGRSTGEAETLKAALAENDIAVETVAAAIAPQTAAAEARLYCVPPARVTAYFPPRGTDLTEESRRLLTLAAASRWGTATPLVVRGYAGDTETADPLKLGLDRAQAARAFLIALGLSPKRLAIEANTRATGQNALRVEILAASPP